jgi:hypothetical protein
MTHDVGTGNHQSVSALVQGVIDDARNLLNQQIALLRHEVKSDLQKTKEAARNLALGTGISLVAALSVWLMLVHLLHWAAPDVPLWGWYGVVGGLCAIVGGALLFLGREKLRVFNPLPDQSAQALKETIQWKTNPR